MPPTLERQTSQVIVIPEGDPVDGAGMRKGGEDVDVIEPFTTILAFAVAAIVLLAVILGVWWAGGPVVG